MYYWISEAFSRYFELLNYRMAKYVKPDQLVSQIGWLKNLPYKY